MSEDVPMPCDVCGGTIYPGDGCCDDCYFAKVMDLRTDYDRGLDDGRGLERAAIVAWLRNCDGFTRFTVTGAEGSSIAMWDKNDYADAVEHGGHLRDDDEHSSFRAALEERIANAVQGERKRIASWIWKQAAEPLTTWVAGVNDE